MFLLDGTSLAVEILNIVEPCDTVGYPGTGGFEAILLLLEKLLFSETVEVE